MTSTCCNARRCLQDLPNATLRSASIRSMGIEYYLIDGVYPWWTYEENSQPHGNAQDHILQHNKRVVEKMWTEHFVKSR